MTVFVNEVDWSAWRKVVCVIDDAEIVLSGKHRNGMLAEIDMFNQFLDVANFQFTISGQTAIFSDLLLLVSK